MPEYRYHRMTENRFGWKRPHTGRLGDGEDYVSKEGFGHEDWNFAGDVWDDGRYHLYLTKRPKKDDLNKVFNIVLGVHTSYGAMMIGFAENVEYRQSNLSDPIWQRRAQEVKALEEDEQLGPLHRGQSIQEIKDLLIDARGMYDVSVAPSDLHIIHQPQIIPSTIKEINTPRYMLLHMTAGEYEKVTNQAASHDLIRAADFDDDTSFPEGRQVERLHRSRERSRKLVNRAKKEFRQKYGNLHCEACGMEPSKYFKDESLAGKIIEAHHNVSIADAAHSGRTQIEDLSMLCPSCHRAIHSIRPWLSVTQLRQRLA